MGQHPPESEQSGKPMRRKDRKWSDDGGENTLNRVCPIFLLVHVLEDKGCSSLPCGNRMIQQKTQHRKSQQEFFVLRGQCL